MLTSGCVKMVLDVAYRILESIFVVDRQTQQTESLVKDWGKAEPDTEIGIVRLLQTDNRLLLRR